jgi:dTDP-4-dehydrorhamnose 3,5-epimerase-like enzyme
VYKIVRLNINKDERGQLVAIESNRDIPFRIKRVFYIFNITQNKKRAQHVNIKAQELVLCLNGCCEILLDNGKGQHMSVTLDQNNEAVYIKPKIWIEISNCSKDCLLLAMSDIYYNRKYQIHDYQEFIRYQRDKVFRSAFDKRAISQ